MAPGNSTHQGHGQGGLHTLSTTTIDDRLKGGSTPVVVPFQVPDATYFYIYLRFLDIIDSPEENRIFELRVQPERLDLSRTDNGGEVST